MKTYLYRGTLTASTCRELLAHPRDVGQGMRTSIARFGGKVVACYFYGNNPNGFLQFPDDQTANAWAVAYGAQEGVAFGEFFAVFTSTEMTEALRLAAGKVGYAEDARDISPESETLEEGPTWPLHSPQKPSSSEERFFGQAQS